MVLPQFKVSSFVDSQWEVSHFQRSGWGWVKGGGGEQEKVREEEMWLVCKMNKTFKRKKKRKSQSI